MELKKQKTYKMVFDIACKDLVDSNYAQRLESAGLMCRTHEKGAVVEIPYFDEVITMDIPGCTFRSSKGANVTLVTKIVILHYINKAAGIPLAGHKVTYGDIPECMHYEPVFNKRVLKPLLSAFGYDRYAFREAGLAMGGKEEEYGDASFTLFAFPRVPMTFILWEGDEEFPPSAKALFDPSITGYLSFEDIVVVSKLASARILKKAHKQHMDDASGDM